MPTPPTLVSYAETTWNAAGDASGNKTLTISWNSGDFLIALLISEANDTLSLSGGTGLTWVTQKSNTAAGSCGTLLSAASPGSSQTTQTITLHNPNGQTGGNHWGGAIWVWRNSGGLGNSAEQHTSTKTVALTPTAADSGIMWGVGDFSAGAGPAATPTPTHARQAAVDGGRYSFVVADIADQTSGGSTSYGLTVTGTTGPYSIVVMEVKGTAAAFQPDEDFVNLNQADPGPPAQQQSVAQAMTSLWQDDPAGNLTATVDEYFWINPAPPPPPYQPQPIGIDEQTPLLFPQPDEDFWPLQSTLQLALINPQPGIWLQDQGEIVPQGALPFQPDEDYWPTFLWQMSLQARYMQLITADSGDFAATPIPPGSPQGRGTRFQFSFPAFR